MGEKSPHMGDGWRVLQGSLSNRCWSCYARGTVLAHRPSRSSGKGRDGRERQRTPIWRKVRDLTGSPLPLSTAGCSVLVNTSCRLVNLTAHLRQKAGLPPDEGEDMASTRYESLLENLDDHYPELAEELRRLSGLSSVGHNWRKRMGTRRGRHEQSPTSRPRKVQTDNNPAGLLLQNLELLRSCISKRGKVRQDLRPPGAPKLWVQRMGCRGRDKKGRGGRYP
eukprot:XP_011528214.1 uncharacterized protein C22orf15 isoform X12 [Homo sapiens]